MQFVNHLNNIDHLLELDREKIIHQRNVTTVLILIGLSYLVSFNDSSLWGGSMSSSLQNRAPGNESVPVKKYLEQSSIQFESLLASKAATTLKEAAISLKLPLKQVIRSCLLKGQYGYQLAMTSCDRLIDYSELVKEFDEEYEIIVPGKSPFQQYYNKGFDSYIVCPKLVNLDFVCDFDINPNEKVYIPSEESRLILAIAGEDFVKMIQSGPKIKFTKLIEHTSSDTTQAISPHEKMPEYSGKKELPGFLKKVKKINKQHVSAQIDMPTMPGMADKLLNLRANPNASVSALGKLIAEDPSLSAQLISWSKSAYYGYPGEIKTINDAIVNVLGYDYVMDIGVTLSLNKVLKIAPNGPIGLLNYWRHSLLTATLMEQLIQLLPDKTRPNRGTVFLCGLLHNLGILALGNFYPQHFAYLNRMIAINPGIHINELEHVLYGTDHQTVGAWLAKAWHLPDEVLTCIFYHHELYSGKNCIYPQLALLSNQLLAQNDMGDDIFNSTIYRTVLGELGCSSNQVQTIFAKVWSHKSELDQIAQMIN